LNRTAVHGGTQLPRRSRSDSHLPLIFKTTLAKMRRALFVCGLYLGSASVTITSSLSTTTPSPPSLAQSFSIDFIETFVGFPAPPFSTGSWYYDYPQRLWRADHHAPNVNNFCSCVTDSLLNLSCSLIFSPGTGTGVSNPGLYVDFPEKPESCCFLCSDSIGCSPLIPDWLAGSNFTGTVDNCNEFCEQGAEAMDCMSFPPSGAMPPCKYMETFSMGSQGKIYHNLSFIKSSYTPGPPDASLFALRPECSKSCPKTFPDQCGR